MEIKVSKSCTFPVYDIKLSNDRFFRNRRILEIDGIEAVDSDGKEIPDQDVYVTITYTGKSSSYIDQKNKESISKMDYEIIWFDLDFSKADDKVTRNCMDISEGGSEIYISIDHYLNGDFIDRHWYEFNLDMKEYEPCSEPESLKDIATPLSYRDDVKLDSKEKYYRKISGFY